MTTRTMVFEAEIDGKKFKGQLKELGRQADKEFNQASKGANSLNVSIGKSALAVAGVTAALFKMFDILQDVSQLAAETFADLVKRGVELNSTFELSGTILGNALNDPQLGQAAVRVVDELAKKFRANRGDAQEFAQSILPRSDSIETFTELLRLVDIQADTTGKSFDELGFSIREALAGDFVSLKDQFDIGKDTIARIRELAPEIGQSAALAQALREEFERLGKTNVADGTFSGSLKDLRTAYDDFAQTVGEPVFEELKEQITAVLQAINDNEEGVTRFGQAIGDLAAAATRLIGTELTDFINGLDFEALESGVDNITRLINAISAVIEIVKFGVSSGALEIAFGLSTGNVAIASGGFIKAAATDYEDLGNVLKRVFDEQQQLEADLQKSISERGVVDRSVSDDVKNRIDAELKAKFDLQQQNKQLAETEAELAKAQEKVTKATEDANRARENADLDLEIRQQRRLTDELLANARAREDIARANAEDIADINRKNAADIEDAATDLSRQEADIARRGSRQRRRIAQDEANQRLSIERDFRQQLEQIRRTFEQSAQEAERNNDAIAFARAVRSRDNSIADATANRDAQIEDAKVAAQQQREVLRASLQAEIEDAQIANTRKIEDLRSRLGRELEEQAIKNQRELEEQAILEARKEADRLERDARELADLERQFERKQEALDKSLKDEFAAIAKAEQAKTELVQQQEQKRVEIAKQGARQRAQANQIGVSTRATSNAGSVPILHDGGFLGAGQTALVQSGERFFTAPQNGLVAPQQMFSPPALRSMIGGNTTINNSTSASLTTTPNIASDPIMVDKLTNAVLNKLLSESTGL